MNHNNLSIKTLQRYKSHNKIINKLPKLTESDKVQALIIQSAHNDEAFFNKNDFSQKIDKESLYQGMCHLMEGRFVKYEHNKNIKTFDQYQQLMEEIEQQHIQMQNQQMNPMTRTGQIKTMTTKEKIKYMQFLKEYQQQKRDNFKTQQNNIKIFQKSHSLIGFNNGNQSTRNSQAPQGYKSLYSIQRQETQNSVEKQQQKSKDLNKLRKQKRREEEEHLKNQFISMEIGKKQKNNPSLIELLQKYIRNKQNMLELREYQRDKTQYNMAFRTEDINDVYEQNIVKQQQFKQTLAVTINLL
eukprot:403370784